MCRVLLATLRGHDAEVTDLSVSADSTVLASADLVGVIRIWCLKTGMQICECNPNMHGT